VGLLFTVALAVVGYFVNQLDKRIEGLRRDVAEHDRQDDERFEKLGVKIDPVKDDGTTKRHTFRSEMHAHVAEVELRLTRDIMRVEGKVDKTG